MTLKWAETYCPSSTLQVHSKRCVWLLKILFIDFYKHYGMVNAKFKFNKYPMFLVRIME